MAHMLGCIGMHLVQKLAEPRCPCHVITAERFHCNIGAVAAHTERQTVTEPVDTDNMCSCGQTYQ